MYVCMEGEEGEGRVLVRLKRILVFEEVVFGLMMMMTLDGM